MNRKLTGQIATLHFAPTPRNRDNLAREGITEGVSVVGNTVVDAIHMTVKPDFSFRDEQLKSSTSRTIVLSLSRLTAAKTTANRWRTSAVRLLS